MGGGGVSLVRRPGIFSFLWPYSSFDQGIFPSPFITSKGEFGLISPETDSKRSEYRGVVILRLRTYVSISTPIFVNINSVNMPFNLLSMSEP